VVYIRRYNPGGIPRCNRRCNPGGIPRCVQRWLGTSGCVQRWLGTSGCVPQVCTMVGIPGRYLRCVPWWVYQGGYGGRESGWVYQGGYGGREAWWVYHGRYGEREACSAYYTSVFGRNGRHEAHTIPPSLGDLWRKRENEAHSAHPGMGEGYPPWYIRLPPTLVGPYIASLYRTSRVQCRACHQQCGPL